MEFFFKAREDVHHFIHSEICLIYKNYCMETFCQVGLGVLDENEASTEGIVKVMQHLHKYVPGHGTDEVVPILSRGDLRSYS